MYAKLTLRNIRRSLRDYGLYFLTLVFAVAIFYVFNSLGDQPAFTALRESTRRLAGGAVEMLEGLTLVMTGVVALLVLYANRVIIKKRSRELGTYLLLGMEQGHLSLLLLAEITVIGMAALVVGQVAGIFLSQFFALLVGRLFGAVNVAPQFVFSASASVRTLVTYGLTFVLVGLWQAASLYRQRLIDLITGVRKNEAIRLQSRLLSLVAGVLSVGSLGYAYYLADQVSREIGLDPKDPRVVYGALLGVVGTYLLFVALAGLLTAVRQRRQGGWLSRGLNLFLYRQVTSKINTHSTMLATISLMLTFTICAMAFGLGLGRGMRERAEAQLPFDYLISSTVPNESFAWAYGALEQFGISRERTVEFPVGSTELRGKDLMLEADAAWFQRRGTAEFVAEVHAKILSASVYQRLRALKGYPQIDLPAGSYLIHASAEGTEEARRAREAHQHFLASSRSVTVVGVELRPGSRTVYTEPLGEMLTGAAAVVVVPDEVAATTMGPLFLAVELEGEPSQALDAALVSPREDQDGYRSTFIRSDVVTQTFVIEGMLLFITGYIGVMFILISATLLALQQVTDAVEHRQRFEVLRKLGADDPMIDGAIAKQVGLYFLTPVAVALLHSLVAMVALARLFELGAGYTTVWSATLVTLAIFVLIYGAYYLLSLASCRTLFKEAQPR